MSLLSTQSPDEDVGTPGPISTAAGYAPAGGTQPMAPRAQPTEGDASLSPASGSAPAAQARPSNVRAYLPMRQNSTPQQPAAPTVDPAAFASQVTSMRQVDPSASLGQAVDAHVAANTYAKNYLAALHEAQGAYSGETGRITSLANANLSGAHAELAGAQTEEAGARTADTEAGTGIKRYSLEQQKNLQELTTKLQDPKLSATERRNLEMQLWILHGKPPRPDNRYEAVQGRVDPMTGTIQPGVILDRSTGQTQPLDRGEAKAPPSDPQAEARAAVAAGANKDAVNKRLRTMGQPELQ